MRKQLNNYSITQMFYKQSCPRCGKKIIKTIPTEENKHEKDI